MPTDTKKDEPPTDTKKDETKAPTPDAAALAAAAKTPKTGAAPKASDELTNGTPLEVEELDPKVLAGLANALRTSSQLKLDVAPIPGGRTVHPDGHFQNGWGDKIDAQGNVLERSPRAWDNREE